MRPPDEIIGSVAGAAGGDPTKQAESPLGALVDGLAKSLERLQHKRGRPQRGTRL